MGKTPFHSGFFRKSGTLRHSLGFVKLGELMREVITSKQAAELTACRLQNASFKYMFHASSGNVYMPIPPNRPSDWTFFVFCSRCKEAHEFEFQATENSLKDYMYMRGLTYG